MNTTDIINRGSEGENVRLVEPHILSQSYYTTDRENVRLVEPHK
jgi:hypothetical protein